jgi:hypothetical protein
MPPWATDCPAKIANVVAVETAWLIETAWLSDRVDALGVDDVIISSIIEADAVMRCSKLISSHLGCWCERQKLLFLMAVSDAASKTEGSASVAASSYFVKPKLSQCWLAALASKVCRA